MGNREDAKKILTYYFRKLADHAGMRWDSDNDAEIEAAVDMIIDAAKEEMANQ